jgi:sialate O-acetylesterase
MAWPNPGDLVKFERSTAPGSQSPAHLQEKIMRASRLLVTAALCGWLAAFASADVKLPAIFSDNMVLQRSGKTPVFGWADKGEKVSVKIGGASAEAMAGDNGKWMAMLDTSGIDAGSPVEVSVSGNNSIAIKNVLVGEVWLASGQSNMEWVVANSKDADMEIAQGDHPGVRMFTVKKAVAEEPSKDVEGKWEVCSPQTVGRFSAVGYFFARDLNQQLKAPVGVIHTSWGGTPAESWTSKEMLASEAEFKPIVERHEKFLAEYPANKAKHEEATKKWQEGGRKGQAPRAPQGPGHPWTPSGLYNAMIAPLEPVGVKGAIWYQGESNADRAYQYRKLFAAMINDWRSHWGQAGGDGNFSFYFVQLANYQKREPQPVESPWAELREAQTMALSLPKTGMAVIIDVGEANDIHPRNKQDVGRRLARWALAKDYGKNVPYTGPVLDAMKVEGDTVRLKFKNLGGGALKVVGEKLVGFAVAGEDKKFVWATASIDAKEKDVVVLKASGISNPVAVRYAWANNPDANLYDMSGLPAGPFRTDDWKGVTVGKN